MNEDESEVVRIIERELATSADTDLAGLTALHKAVLVENMPMIRLLQEDALHAQDKVRNQSA